MKKPPSIDRYNADPLYLRGVLSEIKDETLLYKGRVSVRAVARRIGVSERTLQKYLSNSAKDRHQAPYPVQYTIEGLATNEEEDHS